MDSRKYSDANYLLSQLAKYNVVDLMIFINKYIPTKSFRALHYEQRALGKENPNPEDYICYSLATDNTLQINAETLKNCIVWLKNEKKDVLHKYQVILNSLQALLNFKENSAKNISLSHKDLVVPGAYINLQRADLKKADFSDADLRLANLRLSILDGATLANSKLILVKCEYASFRNVDLSHANLTAAELLRTKFINANLQEATLVDAQMQSAALNNADLYKANLEHANLGYASFEGANLQKANLIDTYLRGINLKNANLNDAVFFSKEQLHPYQLRQRLNQLAVALKDNPDLKEIRLHIAADLRKQSLALNHKRQKEILAIAYKHALFKPMKNSGLKKLANKFYKLFHKNSRLRIESSSQKELMRETVKP